MARAPGRPAWNHKALISPGVGRGRYPPPPPAETPWGPRGQAEARPMLPARSAQAPGPQQKQSHYFQTAKLIQNSKYFEGGGRMEVSGMAGDGRSSGRAASGRASVFLYGNSWARRGEWGQKMCENFRIGAVGPKKGCRIFDGEKGAPGQKCPKGLVCRTRMGRIGKPKILKA